MDIHVPSSAGSAYTRVLASIGACMNYEKVVRIAHVFLCSPSCACVLNTKLLTYMCDLKTP